MWQSYTPDGRLLILRRSGDGWLATSLSRRGESESAEQAIREALGAPLDGNSEALEAWIVEHVAALEAAGER